MTQQINELEEKI